MTLSYDIAENENGDLALFLFRQDGVPENPTIHYNAHKKLVTLRRTPEQVHEIILDQEDAITAFSEKDEISILEVGENDPEESLGYTLKIGKS